jgi:hypothetical protein
VYYKTTIKSYIFELNNSENMFTLEQNYDMMAQPSEQISQRHSLWRAGDSRIYPIGQVRVGLHLNK